jgi:Fur family transcriptional regulator, ferric uptake regulator
MRPSLTPEHDAPTPGRTAIRREDALPRFEAFLARRDLRLTAARRAIVEAVLEREGHFPIEDLVRDLKRRGIRGSKATVYRTLPLLTEAGIVQPAVITGETKSYEAAVGREHHDHLVCRGCGRVIEFEFEAFEILQREVAAKYGFTLEAHHHQLFGRCPECRAAHGDDGGHHARAHPASPRNET